MEARSAFVSTVTMTTLLPWLLLLLQTGSGDGVVFGVSSGGSSGRFVYLFLFCERWGGFCIPKFWVACLGCRWRWQLLTVSSVGGVSPAAAESFSSSVSRCWGCRWSFSGSYASRCLGVGSCGISMLGGLNRDGGWSSASSGGLRWPGLEKTARRPRSWGCVCNFQFCQGLFCKRLGMYCSLIV